MESIPRLIPHYTKGKISFLNIDVQSNFQKFVPAFDQCVRVSNRFAAATGIFPNAKFVCTEQYAKFFGNTHPNIKLPAESTVFAKNCFSAAEVVGDHLKDSDTVVFWGVEGHVCVWQSAIELLEKFPEKRFVVSLDGVKCINQFDLDTVIHKFNNLCVQSGGRFDVQTSDMVLFQLVRTADDPLFKKLNKIIKEFPVYKSL